MRLPDPLLEGRSPRPYPQQPVSAQIPAGAARGAALLWKARAQLPTRMSRQREASGIDRRGWGRRAYAAHTAEEPTTVGIKEGRPQQSNFPCGFTS